MPEAKRALCSKSKKAANDTQIYKLGARAKEQQRSQGLRMASFLFTNVRERRRERKNFSLTRHPRR
jgi:hypothetical protein